MDNGGRGRVDNDGRMAADRTPTEQQQSPPRKWMDHVKARLPPCTLEALPEPIELPALGANDAGGGDDDDRHGRQLVWPVLLGCYRLDAPPGDGEGQQHQQQQQQQQRRSGRLDVLTIRVPDVASNAPSMPLRFEELPAATAGGAAPVLDPSASSGILDSKWRTGDKTFTLDSRRHLSSRLFATAHSTGEVRVHALNVPLDDEIEGARFAYNTGPATATATGAAALNVQANVGVGAPTSEVFPAGAGPCPVLCLSLNWRQEDSPPPQTSHPAASQIVSTYSNGHVAIHDVLFAPSGSDDGQQPATCQLITRDCWSAHSMFTSPSEVWSAAFVGRDDRDTNSVATGGDEGTLKLWDVRATARPTSVLKGHFAAGVTCVSPHPRLGGVFAAGSYDESVNLYDVRATNKPLCRSENLGGGIWRLQWHPLNDRRLLVAAMHGGCLVSQYKRLVPSSPSTATATANAPFPTFPRQLHNEPSSLLYPSIAACPTNSFDSTLTDPSSAATAAGGGGGSSSAANRIRLRVKKTFEEHGSMVYGASWLVCRHPKQPGSYFEAAASCSFYDRNVYVWDSVF